MEHIGNILRHDGSIFDAVHEKGSREWHVFSAVAGDRVDLFAVSLPNTSGSARVNRGYPGHLTPEFSS